MINPTQKAWIESTAAAAEAAGHIFPSMAACEAALESGFGSSLLARVDNNLFGTKQHVHPIYGTHNLPTKEYNHTTNLWEVVNAAWVSYPDLAACFADRMSTLRRLESSYPDYAAALDATDAETFVRAVSRKWSTDPQRADKVIGIHNQVYGSAA